MHSRRFARYFCRYSGNIAGDISYIDNKKRSYRSCRQDRLTVSFLSSHTNERLLCLHIPTVCRPPWLPVFTFAPSEMLLLIKASAPALPVLLLLCYDSQPTERRPQKEDGRVSNQNVPHGQPVGQPCGTVTVFFGMCFSASGPSDAFRPSSSDRFLRFRTCPRFYAL